jgi:hypothetical protein
MSHRLLSAAMAALALGYAIDVFLPWIWIDVGRISLSNEGLDIAPAAWGFLTALALALWALGAALSRQRRRWDAPIASGLAVGTGLLGLAAFIDARSGLSEQPKGELAYGAWIALPLSILLVAGGLAHVVEHFVRDRPR